MVGRTVVALSLLLVAAACATQPIPDGRATFTLTDETRTDDAIYIEGALPFVEIRSETHGVGLSITWADQVGSGGSFEEELPIGRYMIKSNVSPCDDSCNELGEPTDHCDATFELETDAHVDIFIERFAGRPCQIAISVREADGS